jgi:hypothetical protein
MDTPESGVQDEEEGAPGKAGQGKEESEFVVGTYKSRDEAERGIREKDETINRLRSERDRAAAALQEKMANALTKLAEGQSGGGGKASADAEAQVEALVAEMAEAFRADEAKGVRKTLEVFNRYLTDVEKAGSDRVEKTRAELREEFNVQMAEMKALLEDRDPEYVPLKDRVSELAKELGVDVRSHRELLVKLAKRDAKTQHPERHELPGGVVGGGGRASDDGSDMSSQELAMLEGFVGKLSDKERAALKRAVKG